jgi:hypothetical protein
MSKPSKTPSTIPAENASQLNCERSFGIEMCCVNGGLFKVSMSVGHRQVYTMSNIMISLSLVFDITNKVCPQ